MLRLKWNGKKKIKIEWWMWGCGLILLGALISNLRYLCRGDLLYHTDIARDFLILEEMVDEKKLSLIGARSSIPGVFHGPAWYYLNLPVFYLNAGNPAATGWFWLVLCIAAAVGFYFCGARIFGKRVAFLALTLLVSLKAALPIGLGQQSGALFLSFIYFYLLWLYLQEKKWWQLALAVLIIGMIIQFQMAFGGPMLLTTGLYLIYKIWKNKNYAHLWCFVCLLIPLSTFIVFDLKHQFLQTQSVWHYFVGGDNGGAGFSIQAYLKQRMWAIVDCFKLVNTQQWWIMLSTSAASGLAFFYAYTMAKKESSAVSLAGKLSAIMIGSFWLITLPFKGSIWSFYYESLLPIFIIWIAYAIIKMKKKWIMIALMVIMLVNVNGVWRWDNIYFNGEVTDHETHWAFYKRLSDDIQKNAAEEDFSYYVFTMDRYGYQVKYAMSYMLKKTGQQKHVHEKLPTTYLIIGRNDWGETYIRDWQLNDVKIGRTADKEWQYNSGYKVKRYNLSDKEQLVEANPNLIKGLEMR